MAYWPGVALAVPKAFGKEVVGSTPIFSTGPANAGLIYALCFTFVPISIFLHIRKGSSRNAIYKMISVTELKKIGQFQADL